MRPPDMLLPQVIVGISFQPDIDASRKKAPDSADASFKIQLDGAVRQAPGAWHRHNLAAEPASHCAMHIADGQVDAYLLLVFNRRLTLANRP